MFESNIIEHVVLGVVTACWLAFVFFFLFVHKKPAKTAERKRDNTWRWGLALEVAGFALLWGIRRPYFTPIVPMSLALEMALAIVACVLAPASAWICFAAARALGKQFALVARTLQGHMLVTGGPYGIVRNPIYLGMFGMLLATGLAVSRWWALPLAIALYLIGNSIRIHAEEKLLRESFGPEFEAYARRVPAMWPRLLR